MTPGSCQDDDGLSAWASDQEAPPTHRNPRMQNAKPGRLLSLDHATSSRLPSQQPAPSSVSQPILQPDVLSRIANWDVFSHVSAPTKVQRQLSLSQAATSAGKLSAAHSSRQPTRSESSGHNSKAHHASSTRPTHVCRPRGSTAPSSTPSDAFSGKLSGVKGWASSLRADVRDGSPFTSSPERVHHRDHLSNTARRDGHKARQKQLLPSEQRELLPPDSLEAATSDYATAQVRVAQQEVHEWAVQQAALAESRLQSELDGKILALVDTKTAALAGSQQFKTRVIEAIQQLQRVLAQVDEEERQVEEEFESCCQELAGILGGMLKDVKQHIATQARTRLHKKLEYLQDNSTGYLQSPSL